MKNLVYSMSRVSKAGNLTILSINPENPKSPYIPRDVAIEILEKQPSDCVVSFVCVINEDNEQTEERTPAKGNKRVQKTVNSLKKHKAESTDLSSVVAQLAQSVATIAAKVDSLTGEDEN